MMTRTFALTLILLSFASADASQLCAFTAKDLLSD